MIIRKSSKDIDACVQHLWSKAILSLTPKVSSYEPLLSPWVPDQIDDLVFDDSGCPHTLEQ